MIIAISGMPGSGKSTVARRLSRALGYKHYYMGALRRRTAHKLGFTLEEFNKKGEADPSTDLFVEKYIQKLARTQDNFIIESRTAWAFIPHALKIFIHVDIEEGARRIFKSLHNPKSRRARNEGAKLDTLNDVIQSVRKRLASDAVRYKKYYNINIMNKNNYDLFLDATDLSPTEEYMIVQTFVTKILRRDAVQRRRDA